MYAVNERENNNPNYLQHRYRKLVYACLEVYGACRHITTFLYLSETYDH